MDNRYFHKLSRGESSMIDQVVGHALTAHRAKDSETPLEVTGP